MLHPCSSNHDLDDGLPAGRRWQVGWWWWQAAGRCHHAQLPEWHTGHLELGQNQTFPAAPSEKQTQQRLVRVTERQPGREIDRTFNGSPFYNLSVAFGTKNAA